MRFRRIEFVFVLAVLSFYCGGEVSEKQCKSDLQKGIFLFGSVEDLSSEQELKIKEPRADGVGELLYIPFSANIRLKEDVRNYVHHAQEGRYHREYVGWVMKNSANAADSEKLYQFSLLANLSSSRWYDAKSGEVIPLKGVLRYKKERGQWVSLGAFDH